MTLSLGLPHPGDASRWVPVADLLAELYAKLQAAGAMLDQQAQTLIDHDVQFKVHGEALDAHRTALDGMAAQIETLTGRLKEESDARAELAVWATELEARIEALEPQNGPAFGVDVSGHQTLAQVQAAAGDNANRFVIVKATEGEGWKADVYPAQVGAVRTAGKLAGAYHFAWCNQDPLKEAANFLAGAALKPGDMAALDLERETAGESWATRVTYALAWLDEVKAKTGATPLVYVNWNWIKGLRTAATVAQWDRLVAYPLWLAQWTGTAGQFDTVSPKTGSSKGWPVVVHQYAVVDNLDRNWTPDLAALRALAVK